MTPKVETTISASAGLSDMRHEILKNNSDMGHEHLLKSTR